MNTTLIRRTSAMAVMIITILTAMAASDAYAQRGRRGRVGGGRPGVSRRGAYHGGRAIHAPVQGRWRAVPYRSGRSVRIQGPVGARRGVIRYRGPVVGRRGVPMLRRRIGPGAVVRHPRYFRRPWRRPGVLPLLHPRRNYYRRYAGVGVGWFGPNWRYRPGYWRRWRFDHYPRRYWWRYPTWGALAGWGVWNWSRPIYYDYGTNVVCDDGQVYYDGEPAMTTSEFAVEAGELAEKGQKALSGDADLSQESWKSLGVFALLEPGKNTPKAFLQMAVTKNGIVGGTYYLPEEEDRTEPITGSVDPDTQRAAWYIGDDRNELMEAGIANLTKDETPVLIHVKDGEPLTWKLVRQAEPDEDFEKDEEP